MAPNPGSGMGAFHRERVVRMQTMGTSTSRDTLYIAVFGTLWGLLEITLGTGLKSLRIPFTGFIMVALALVILLAGRYFVPRRGSILMMGGVAALLKIFSIGGFVLGPFWAILIEALLAEIIITTMGLRRLSCMLTGVVLLAYTTIHPLIAQRVLYGSGIIQIYLEMLDRGRGALGLQDASLWLVVGSWLLVITVLGSAVGLAGHRLGREVEQRVHRLRARSEVA
jgi:hypothetical protein